MWAICTQKVPEQEKHKEYLCKLSQEKENYMGNKSGKYHAQPGIGKNYCLKEKLPNPSPTPYDSFHIMTGHFQYIWGNKTNEITERNLCRNN